MVFLRNKFSQSPNTPWGGPKGGEMGNEIFLHAREQRRNGTRAERRLWSALRNRRLGRLKFRRQHPIGQFIADFYCASARLVVELDGDCHGTGSARKRDEDRDAYFRKRGIRVLRVPNERVEYTLASVLDEIYEVAKIAP